MAASEVTPEKDARWALQCARENMRQAKAEQRRADNMVLRASKRERAALKKLHELGVEP